MLTRQSRDFITQKAHKYGISRVILFGSCLVQEEGESHDIDLATEGLDSSKTELFWDELMWADELGRKPVDLIRIEDSHWLNPIILDEGVVIYEAEPSRITA